MSATKQNVHERRRSQRLTIRQPLFMSFKGGTAHGTSRNISTGGILLDTNSSIPNGSPIEILFVVPADSLMPPISVRMTGRVVRLQAGASEHERFGVAVAFTDIKFVSEA